MIMAFAGFKFKVKPKRRKTGIIFKGKNVYFGARRDAHDFVFRNGSFAMTKTYYLFAKKLKKRKK
jgi:hypothetical protein